MPADLLVVGAGIAGAAAALSAAQLGARVILCDAGSPPGSEERYDLWFDSAFQLVGGPPKPSIEWAYTRFHGYRRPFGHVPEPGYVIDRTRLQAALIAEISRRGHDLRWGTPVDWLGDHYRFGEEEWPAERVILADGWGELGPAACPAETVWWHQWTGSGTPVTSFQLHPGNPEAGGQLIMTATMANTWSAFGWSPADTIDPWAVCLSQPTPPAAHQDCRRIRSPLQEGPPACGPGWLRVGAAAGHVARHGFGWGQSFCLARVAGAMAAKWVLRHAAADEWLAFADWLEIPTYLLRQELPRHL